MLTRKSHVRCFDVRVLVWPERARQGWRTREGFIAQGKRKISSAAEINKLARGKLLRNKSEGGGKWAFYWPACPSLTCPVTVSNKAPKRTQSNCIFEIRWGFVVEFWRVSNGLYRDSDFWHATDDTIATLSFFALPIVLWALWTCVVNGQGACAGMSSSFVGWWRRMEIGAGFSISFVWDFYT